MKKLTMSMISGVLFASALTVGSYSSIAEAKPFIGERGGMKMMKMMSKQLDLTEAQREEMKLLMSNAKIEREQSKAEFQNYRTQLENIIQAEEFDEEAFTALNSTYQPMFKDKALAKAKMRHAMYQILTEEQRAKLDGLKELRAEKKRLRRNMF